MFKYIKRKHINEEEDSENKSKLSQPSMSKAEKEMTDKKLLLQHLLGHGFNMDWKQKLSASVVHCLWEKLSNMATVPPMLSRHFTINHSHLSNKKINSSNFWIYKTNNVEFLRRK
jgi:hypothetical protein